MRTVLNILGFVLDGSVITLDWLLTTLANIMLIFTLPLTRSCQEITKLSLVPYDDEAIHVDELNPADKNVLLDTGDTVLNIFWLTFFDWWLYLMHTATDIAQCISIIDIPVGIANFKTATITLRPADRHTVSAGAA